MDRYGLPKEDGYIEAYYTIGQRKNILNLPGLGNVCGPTSGQLEASGYLLVVDAEYNPFTHKLGQDKKHGSVVHPEIIQLSGAEADEYCAAARLGLVQNAYRLASEKQTDVTTRYCPAEMTRWAGWVVDSKFAKSVDDADPGTGDWTFLKKMICGEAADCSGCDGVTCRDYGMVILEKNTILEEYSDAVVFARNGHKEAISEAVNADLIDYDINLLWPTVIDSDNILYSIG